VFLISDKLRDAMVCYEEAVNTDACDLTAHHGLMKSYLALGHWYLALTHSPCHDSANPLSQSLLPHQIEAAWKLGDWDTLGSLLAKEGPSHSWETTVGE